MPDTNDAKRSFVELKTASTIGAELDPNARVVAVAADDPNYPAYVIRYAGPTVPATSDRTIGPHTFTMAVEGTSASILVEMTRNSTSLGIPDLTVRLTKV